MPLLSWIVLFSLVGGLLSVAAAASFLIVPEAVRNRLLPGLVSVAIGALLAASLVGLLPTAFAVGRAHPDRVGAALLAGILLFFVLEKLVLWRHSHAGHAHDDTHVGHGHVHVHADGKHDHDHSHLPDAAARSAGALIVIGDGMHNMVDGVLIAAAFMTDRQLGIMTSLAVAAHELPQELGDFAILLHAGYSPRKALLLNVLSTGTTVVGALAAYYSLSQAWLPYVLALAAASFIYIAVADLIPGLHRKTGLRTTIKQVSLIALGAAFVLLGEYLLG